MDKFRNEGMSKLTMDTVRIRQNNRNIKICKRKGNFTSFKGEYLYNFKKANHTQLAFGPGFIIMLETDIPNLQ